MVKGKEVYIQERVRWVCDVELTMLSGKKVTIPSYKIVKCVDTPDGCHVFCSFSTKRPNMMTVYGVQESTNEIIQMINK